MIGKKVSPFRRGVWMGCGAFVHVPFRGDVTVSYAYSLGFKAISGSRAISIVKNAILRQAARDRFSIHCNFYVDLTRNTAKQFRAVLALLEAKR